MMAKFLLCVSSILLLLLRAKCLFAGDSCFYEDQPGTCKLLMECQPLITEIRSAGLPMPMYLREKLININCGYERDRPIVCCVPQSGWKPTETHGMGLTDDNNQSNNNWGTNQSTTQITRDTHPGTSTHDDNSINRNNAKGPIIVQGHPNIALLPIELCGISEGDRIFGGKRTNLYEMPWMVLLSYDSARGPKLSCGGTLISEWYVLTAAHCVSFLGTRLRLTSVILGEYDIREDPDCERVEDRQFCAPNIRNVPVDKVIAHPGYSPQTLFDDIALIRLSEPADFKLATMKPICLPVTPELQRLTLEGEVGIVAGWGATEDGLQSPVLLSVNLPIINNKDCQLKYHETPTIHSRQLCAGGVADKDSCGGDSGGPLLHSATLGAYGIRSIQHGIVSFGSKQCGLGGFPGVYTRVTYYMKWILDNMQ